MLDKQIWELADDEHVPQWKESLTVFTSVGNASIPYIADESVVNTAARLKKELDRLEIPIRVERYGLE